MAQELAPHVLVPAGLLAGAAMVILTVDMLATPRGGHPAAGAGQRRVGLVLAFLASVAFLGVAVVGLIAMAGGPARHFDAELRMIVSDGLSGAGVLIVAVGGLLTLWLSSTYLIALRINHGEYHALLLLSAVGMVGAVGATNMVLLYVCLELASIALFVLIAFDQRKLRSAEAGLKAMLTHALASGFLLYGIAMLFGATGQFGHAGLEEAIAQLAAAPAVAELRLALAGSALVLVGLLFKLALVPFHQWAPDAGEGAPTPVAAFLLVCLLPTATIVLLRLLGVFAAFGENLLGPIFGLLALASMGVGHLMALVQHDIRRMLAYCAIGSMGQLAIGLAVGGGEAYAAVLFQLFAQLFLWLGAMGVVITLASAGRDAERIEDLTGIGHERPAMAALLTLFLLGLAGVPGTVGFWAKFQIFSAAASADQTTLLAAGVISSALSLFYLLRVPIAMYMNAPGAGAKAHASTNELLVLGVCAVAVVWLGIFPGAELPGVGVGLLDALGDAASAPVREP